MTKYRIIHETIYEYSALVFFEPHYLRLKPKNTPHCSLKEFTLSISPEPEGFAEQIDMDNNLIYFCWFEGVHQHYEIKAESVVELEDYNPFNFIIYPDEFLKIPFSYADEQRELLQPALWVMDLPQYLIEFGDDLIKKSGFNTVNFITVLTQQIHKQFAIEIREHGRPHDPDLTFQLKKGSCRDVAWMQIQLLRYFGIAARFTSGYFYIESDNPEFELHAWLEVFIPGAGWIGFDPSHGIAAGSSHIPVANSAFIENTMPVTGSVRGDGSSELKTNLIIEKLT